MCVQNEQEDGMIEKGRVDAFYLKSLNLDINSIFFLCGPPEMIQTLSNSLEKMGVQPSNIQYEKWSNSGV